MTSTRQLLADPTDLDLLAASVPQYTEAAQPEYGKEYELIITSPHENNDVAADCWGALVFVIVSDFPDIRSRRLNFEGFLRIVTAAVGFTLNIVIQFFLLYYIFTLLVLPAMLSAQDLYEEFHKEAFAGHKPNFEAFDRMDEEAQADICEFALSEGIFLRVILFLWITYNVGEIKTSLGFVEDIYYLPRLPDGHDTRLMVHDCPKTHNFVEFQIVCLDLVSKVCLTLFVYVPKIVIAIVLSLSGSIWLMASQSIGDLLLNSLALAFVVSVDELLATVFFPQCFIQNIRGCGFAAQLDAPGNVDEAVLEANARRRRANAYIKGSVILFASMVFVELVIYFQPVIPDYGGDVDDFCASYLQKKVPWCVIGQGSWQDCFPVS